MSCLTSLFIPLLSTIAFAITPSSFANGSNCAVPITLTPFAEFILFNIALDFSASKKTLHVIVLLPSNKLNIAKILPDFNSLVSVASISPSIITFPLSIVKSATLTSGSLIFPTLPYITGFVVSSSSAFSLLDSTGFATPCSTLVELLFSFAALLTFFSLFLLSAASTISAFAIFTTCSSRLSKCA